MGGAQWRNGNAAASQQERSGFDSRREHCGHRVMCPLLHVIGAHTLAGVGDRAFLCGVRMLSLCPQGVLMSPQLTKDMQYHCALQVYCLQLAEGRITDEGDTKEDNVIPPRRYAS